MPLRCSGPMLLQCVASGGRPESLPRPWAAASRSSAAYQPQIRPKRAQTGSAGRFHENSCAYTSRGGAAAPTITHGRKPSRADRRRLRVDSQLPPPT